MEPRPQRLGRRRTTRLCAAMSSLLRRGVIHINLAAISGVSSPAALRPPEGLTEQAESILQPFYVPVRICPVARSTAEAAEAFRIDRSNWAAEGFTATQNTNGQGACYSVTSDFASTNVDYTAFVNDIASTCDLAGFDSYGWSTSNGVTDMTAVVGVISYNGSPGTSECGSGISMIPGSTSVTSSGTHVFVAGAFVYHSINGSSCAGTNKTTDGEGIIFDSWTCGSVAYTYQGVAEQNVLWGNGSAGFEIFPNCNKSWDESPYVIFNNTSYGNYQDQYHTGNDGELALQNITPISGHGSYTATKNIFEATTLETGSTDTMVALEVWCQTVCTTEVNVSGNYGWKSNPEPSLPLERQILTCGTPAITRHRSRLGQIRIPLRGSLILADCQPVLQIVPDIRIRPLA